MRQRRPADPSRDAARAAAKGLPEFADRRFRRLRAPPVAAMRRRHRAYAASEVPSCCPPVAE